MSTAQRAHPGSTPGLVVLKVGGSLLSGKGPQGGLDDEAFDGYATLVADLAERFPGRLLLVTGGGALCHPVGLRINQATDDPFAAVALTEPAFAMRWEWTTRLRARGVRAVPLQSTGLLDEDDEGVPRPHAHVVRRLLTVGALPVLSSDCVLTASGTLRILSSDETPAVALGLGFGPVRVVALTDVPGIIAGPDGAGPVLPFVDPDALDAVRPWFWDRSANATGAMAGKVEALAALARRGAECVITRGRHDAGSLRHLFAPMDRWPADLERTLISRGTESLDLTGGTEVNDQVDAVPRGERTVLLNPGPVNVHDRVRAAIASADECHREPEAAALFQRVGSKLIQVCGGTGQHAAVLLTGSGTAALESVISSVIPDSGRLLVLGNGHYAERLAEMARVHGISHSYLDFGWAEPIDPTAVEQALRDDPAITHVAMVHHETSTGMLNPVAEIGRIARHSHRSVIVDAISSLGAEDLDLEADGIDWCVGTANKCLEGLPGISFVCAPIQRYEELADGPRRTMYLDLHGNYVAQHLKQSTRFTPAMQVLRALDVALDLMLEEGVPTRKSRYRALAAMIRDGLSERGIGLLLEPDHRAGSITNAHLWGSLDYQELHDRLKDRGYVIYATQDKSAGSFRLANMGQLTASDVTGLFGALDEVIADHPVAPGAAYAASESGAAR